MSFLLSHYEFAGGPGAAFWVTRAFNLTADLLLIQDHRSRGTAQSPGLIIVPTATNESSMDSARINYAFIELNWRDRPAASLIIFPTGVS